MRLNVKGDRVDDEVNTSKCKITMERVEELEEAKSTMTDKRQGNDKAMTRRRLNSLERTNFAECVCVCVCIFFFCMI